MSRLLIVSRIIPGAEGRVAQIFAESDATDLPGLTGVTHRSLYCLHDLCVHLLETSDVDPDALAAARNHPLFQQVNERLSAHTSPYLPTWRSPRDAIAGCFYRWDATDAPAARPASTDAPVARPANSDAPAARPANSDAPAAHPANSDAPAAHPASFDAPKARPASTDAPAAHPAG